MPIENEIRKSKTMIGAPRSAVSILNDSRLIDSDQSKLLFELMPTLNGTPITLQFARATLAGLRKRYRSQRMSP